MILSAVLRKALTGVKYVGKDLNEVKERRYLGRKLFLAEGLGSAKALRQE